MKFYTNIQLIGNQFLIRGYENGKHITHREEWKPTLFVPSKRKTKYKTLEGDSVEPIQPGFVRDCREFYKKYDEVENFNIYGNCLLYTSPSPRDVEESRMPSSA
mgnify:CR=1 FL=1